MLKVLPGFFLLQIVKMWEERRKGRTWWRTIQYKWNGAWWFWMFSVSPDGKICQELGGSWNVSREESLGMPLNPRKIKISHRGSFYEFKDVIQRFLLNWRVSRNLKGIIPRHLSRRPRYRGDYLPVKVCKDNFYLMEWIHLKSVSDLQTRKSFQQQYC